MLDTRRTAEIGREGRGSEELLTCQPDIITLPLPEQNASLSIMELVEPWPWPACSLIVVESIVMDESIVV